MYELRKLESLGLGDQTTDNAARTQFRFCSCPLVGFIPGLPGGQVAAGLSHLSGPVGSKRAFVCHSQQVSLCFWSRCESHGALTGCVQVPALHLSTVLERRGAGEWHGLAFQGADRVLVQQEGFVYNRDKI